MEKSLSMTSKEQKKFLIDNGEKDPIFSYNQTDFVKSKIAVEVQFGKYSFVAYDLFVKHMLFYSGGVINIGIEVLPTKKMQSQMSSGVAYYEGEVYNVMRQGRNSPPVQSLMRFCIFFFSETLHIASLWFYERWPIWKNFIIYLKGLKTQGRATQPIMTCMRC